MKIFTPTIYNKKKVVVTKEKAKRNGNGNGGVWENYKLNRDTRYWKWHYKFEQELFKEVMF